MQLIVSAHLQDSNEEAAARLALLAAELARDRPTTQWVDEARRVFRVQLRVRDEVLTRSLGQVVARLEEAAGPGLSQLILVGTSGAPARDVNGDDTPPSGTPVFRASPDDRAETPVDVQPVRPAAPPPRTETNARTEAPPKEPLELAVRSAAGDALHGVVVSTGQPLVVQPPTRWDVVEGEVLVFRPTRLWRFARETIATGELVDARVEVGLFGGKPLGVLQRGSVFELERPVLEGDPDDPADDPIEDARAAMKQGQGPTARQLLRGALAENVRCLEAHDLLARLEDADGRPDLALRHSAVVVAFALESLGGGGPGPLPSSLPGNTAMHRALERLESDLQPRYEALVHELRRRLAGPARAPDPPRVRGR